MIESKWDLKLQLSLTFLSTFSSTFLTQDSTPRGSGVHLSVSCISREVSKGFLRLFFYLLKRWKIIDYFALLHHFDEQRLPIIFSSSKAITSFTKLLRSSLNLKTCFLPGSVALPLLNFIMGENSPFSFILSHNL